MRKLTMVFWSAAVLWLGIPAALAQNTVDVLAGPQPANMTGCVSSVSPPRNANCIPATWSTTSNGGTPIAAAIPAKVFLAKNGGAMPGDFPLTFAMGKICLADTRELTGPIPTLFAQIAAYCQGGGGVALLLIRNSAVTAPSDIPVFTISTANGDFLKTSLGFDANGVSNYQIRINVAVAIVPANPTGQHNCPNNQAVTAYVGPGTTNYTPNESLCLPAVAGQAVEPSITVDSQGTIYVESIRGVPGGLDLWRWDRARGPTPDGGPNIDNLTLPNIAGTLPFKYEGQPDCDGLATSACTTTGFAPGGGDGDVAVNAPDSSTNIPNLAVVSLAAVEVTASHSTNRADTFSTPNLTSAAVPFDDRMWINALDDAKHVYMEYHDFGTTSQILVQRSADGGQTYADTFPVVSTVIPPAMVAMNGVVGPPTGNIAGQIKLDRSRTKSHGNVYQIFVGPNSVMDNANSLINAVYVGVASGVSLASNTPLPPFNVVKIFSCVPGITCGAAGLGNLFPALAVDDFGHVYAVWSDNTDIYYSYSTDHGTSWSSAIKVTRVTQPTTQAGMSNVFPWVAADADGHVAIAWYGADKAGNSNTVSTTDTHWNVFVAETVNGHGSTAGAPRFTLSQASDHSNHTGQISTTGLNPTGSDRSLADFFQIAIDPTNHLINIAFADNHAGAAVTYFTRQKKAAGGITGGCAGHEDDGEGDVRGERGGDAHFRFHHDDCHERPDDEEFSDPGEGRDFHSTEVTSVTRDDVAHSVTIVGRGVDNGLSVAFTIVAVDSSLVPPGLFSITLSDGYTNSGTLLDGSIALH
jgi:hypothetical protein